MNGNSLTKAELESLCLGWSGGSWRAAHDTMEAVGGGVAGWLTAAFKSPKVALAIGFPLMIANAFMGAHPVLRLVTSLGPGMLAGASALYVHGKITMAKRADLRVAA